MIRISSAHKTPNDVDVTLKNDYAVVIAGAGLAAHLPGVVAARIFRPVIGVPCEGNYQGLDALLSIAQMPAGIPVLAVGVNNSQAAAENCAKMMKKYNSVTIIGNKNDDAVKKAAETLKKFQIVPNYSDNPNPNTVNIEFTYFDEPVEKKEVLVIYCPLLLEKDDKAEAALNFLKHSTHGLWVGINNGVNAAIAAVEIMNIDNEYEEMLVHYRSEMGKKVLEANK
ncbi:AIR carboxylase family protein [Candidatus Woesearchaeota archaeon]|nr:AIR carboxylase family protein [Candidatus Woesearchaeota archaeon]